MNFTLNNHLSYTVGGRKFGSRENSQEKFEVSIGQIDTMQYYQGGYREELRRTANYVYQDFGKDFAVWMSGGSDSEIVLRSFKEIGINPKCFTIKMKNDYNIQDVIESEKICKELDVDLEIIEFDVKEFFNSGEINSFAQEIQCTQIAYCTVLYNIKKMGLPSVMGGELMLRRNVNSDPSSWYFCFRENEDGCAMRFSLKYDVPVVNEYFSYTPELMLHWLENSYIQRLVNNKYNYKLSSVTSKNYILKQLIPELRPKVKTHGYEKLLAFNYEVYRVLQQNQILRLESSLDGIEINEAIKMLKGKI